MSTAAAALSNPPMGRSMSHTATIYLKEAKYEFLKNLRLRVYTASVITFPLMFYVLFVLVLNSREAIGGSYLFDRNLWHVRGDGSFLVRHSGWPRLRPWSGMVAVKARQPHAALRLFRGEGGHEHDLQRHRRGAINGTGHQFWRSAIATLPNGKAVGNIGSRIASPPWGWPSATLPDRTRRLRPST